MGVLKTKDGCEIVYDVAGDGEPLVMIHGMLHNRHIFKYVVEQLKEHYQVITYDLRGHGESAKPQNFNMENNIEDCLDLINHLKLKKVHLLGYSLGAYIALGFVVKYERRLKSLILSNGKSHSEVSSYARLMLKHRAEIKGLNKKEIINILHQYIYHNVDKVNGRLEELSPYIQLTADEEAVISRSFSGFDYREDIKNIHCPILLIAGRYDVLNTIQESALIKNEIRNAKMIIFEHSGHAPFIEEEDLFIKEVMNFLK